MSLKAIPLSESFLSLYLKIHSNITFGVNLLFSQIIKSLLKYLSLELIIELRLICFNQNRG